MTTLQKITVQIVADTKDVTATMLSLKEDTKELAKEWAALTEVHPSLKGLSKDGKLSIDENFQENLIAKALDPTTKLTDFEKEFLNDIKDISKILKEDLIEASKALQEALKAKNIDPEIIEILVKNFEETGEKRIDDLIEDFTDEIEEAVEALSKAVSEAFVEMALKGEFSARKIGDAFLRVFRWIVNIKRILETPIRFLKNNLKKRKAAFQFHRTMPAYGSLRRKFKY